MTSVHFLLSVGLLGFDPTEQNMTSAPHPPNPGTRMCEPLGHSTDREGVCTSDITLL